MTIIASNCSDNRTKGFTTGNFLGIYVRDANSDLFCTNKCEFGPERLAIKARWLHYISICGKTAYIRNKTNESL